MKTLDEFKINFVANILSVTEWRTNNPQLDGESIEEYDSRYNIFYQEQFSIQAQAAYDLYIIEENRKIDFANRLDALLNLREIATEAGLEQANIKLLRKDIIENNRESDLLLLEATEPTVTANLLNKQNKLLRDTKIALNRKRMSYGENVIAYIGVINNEKGSLTKQNIKDLSAAYKEISQYLKEGSLETARDEIANVVPDGVIITEADKAEILAYLDEKIAESNAEITAAMGG